MNYYYFVSPGHWLYESSVLQCSGRLRFNPSSSHTKTQKMVLDSTLLNTQHYKVQIKGKGINTGKKYHPPLHLGVVAKEKGAFGSPSTEVIKFTYFTIMCDFFFLPGLILCFLNIFWNIDRHILLISILGLLRWRGSHPGDLGNVEYHFIYAAPTLTLIGSGSTL